MTPARPRPPQSLTEHSVWGEFRPAPELEAWARSSFIEDGAKLHNPDHTHLRFARLGFLWTNVPNGRGGRAIVGQCELGVPQAMGKWAKARAEQQLREFFGPAPVDFVLTFDAHYADKCGDAEFCALVEHELYHAGQARDVFGAPAFKKAGGPKFAMRGHDVEEFVGVVRRYGAAAAGVQPLVDAALMGPKVARAAIAGVCGTCLKVAA